ncbi:MAG: PQQ-binding-like beta-propeller repeat protein, partial [Pirellulales bacterium]
HLAEQWVRLGEPTPFSIVGRRLLASPAWFETAEDFWLNDSAVGQLAALVESHDWPGVQHTNNMLRHCEDSLVLKNSLWAANVRHEADSAAAQENVEPIALDWHHPLNIRVGRENFDLLSSLGSLVHGGQFDDACRLIAGSERLTGQGVAASPDDPRLWISLPLAIDRMFRQHPELGERMRASYSTLAEARLRKALADDDVAAILDVSRGFPTTTAAAEADVWLGNHRLTLGEFRSALDHYRRAKASRAIDDSNEFTSRVRLASAMLGADAGEPVRQAVDFQGEALSPAKFESLLSELRDRHRLANRTAAARTAFSPSPLNVASLGRAVASEAIGEIPPPLDYHTAGIAAAARELAVAEHGGAVFVSNRFGVAAFDGEGRRRWEATLGDRAGRANAWPLVRMQPVLAGRRLLARLITQQGPQLFAIDAASGQLLWQARIEAEAEVVSDPIMVGDEALVLVAAGRGREQQISLARFDLASGDRLASTPVMRLAAGWLQYGQARLAAREDAIYAVLGGAVARVQFDGRLDWIRRQNWRPPELTPHWHHQLAPSITFHKELLVVAQPGVDAIEAIDVATGQRLWRYADPTLLGVVDAATEQIVGRNQQGFFVLAAADGRLRTQLSTEVAGDGHYLDDWSTLFFFRRAVAPPHSLQAWWWDAADGELLGGDALAFDDPAGLNNLVIAPLALARGRMIGGAAPSGDNQPAAIIALFRQAGSPELSPPPARSPWTARTVLSSKE